MVCKAASNKTFTSCNDAMEDSINKWVDLASCFLRTTHSVTFPPVRKFNFVQDQSRLVLLDGFKDFPHLTLGPYRGFRRRIDGNKKLKVIHPSRIG